MSARNMAKRTAAGTLALAVCLGGGALALAGAANADTNFKFDTRVEGAERYGTAIAASKAAFPDGTKTDNVVLVNGFATVDGLTASYLAGVANAPILYVSETGADAETKAEIKRLGAKNVWLVGGTTVIPTSVETAIKGDGYNVTRINGTDRYETAKLVAEAGTKIAGKKPAKVFVASGTSFADALAVSPIAYKQGYAIALTEKESTSQFTKDELGAIATDNKILVGGEAVVSKKVQGDLSISDAQRIAGADRAVTANLVSDWAKANEGFSKANAALVGGTNGNGADSLVASALGAKTGTTLHFAGWDATYTYLKDHAAELTGKGFVFGGKAAVAGDQVDKAQAAAASAATPIKRPGIAPTIVSASITSPTEVTIRMSQVVASQGGGTVTASQFQYDANSTAGGEVAASTAVVSPDGGSIVVTFTSGTFIQASSSDRILYNDATATPSAGDIVDLMGVQLASATQLVGDDAAPTILSARAVSATKVLVTMSEPVLAEGGTFTPGKFRYDADGVLPAGAVSPTSADAGATSDKIVLTFASGVAVVDNSTDIITYTDVTPALDAGDVKDADLHPLASTGAPHISVVNAVPTIVSAALGAAVSSSTDWNESGETLTLTFSESITATGSVADTHSMTPAEVRGLTGLATIDFVGPTTVTVSTSGTDKLVLTIGGGNLTTGILHGANVPGAALADVTDSNTNPMVAAWIPVALS